MIAGVVKEKFQPWLTITFIKVLYCIHWYVAETLLFKSSKVALYVYSYFEPWGREKRETQSEPLHKH